LGLDGGKFGADALCGGVVELVEDGQGGLPRVAGTIRVAAGEVGVAEAGECDGFPKVIANVSA
jgi:hypothetical protein